MEFKTTEAKIIIISGKARAGKDTVANYMLKYFESKNIKAINLAYGSYIKEYAKKISNWDGDEETKPRELLQELGTNIIREKIDEEFFIKRMIGDIKVYNYFFDIIIVSDARLIKEIEILRDNFTDVTSINILRPNYDNGLNLKEKNHYTETCLDHYDKYDYNLVNDKSLEVLEKKVINLLERFNF